MIVFGIFKMPTPPQLSLHAPWSLGEAGKPTAFQFLSQRQNHLPPVSSFPLLLFQETSSFSKKCHFTLGFTLSLEIIKTRHVEANDILARNTERKWNSLLLLMQEAVEDVL